MRKVLNSGSLSVRDLSEELKTASNTRESFPAWMGRVSRRFETHVCTRPFILVLSPLRHDSGYIPTLRIKVIQVLSQHGLLNDILTALWWGGNVFFSSDIDEYFYHLRVLCF